MAKLYPREWQVVSSEVTREIQLEFRQDPQITPNLEEGGQQAGNPYRLGFDIVAARALHLSASFDLLTFGFAKRWSYITLLTYYTELPQAVPNKIELGDQGWSMMPSGDSPVMARIASNRDLFKLCSAFAGGEYEVPISRAFRSNKKIRIVRKRFEIVPHQSGSMIIASTLPTAEGGLLKVSEFISLADSIEQTLLT